MKLLRILFEGVQYLEFPYKDHSAAKIARQSLLDAMYDQDRQKKTAWLEWGDVCFRSDRVVAMLIADPDDSLQEMQRKFMKAAQKEMTRGDEWQGDES